MKKFFIIIICILILFVYQMTKTNGASLKPVSTDFVVINNQKVFLDVADTREKVTQGLMGIDSIAENQGMVFLFKKSDYKTFWMKNMKIPLDIVFISNEKIAKIYNEVPICEKYPCPLYESKYKIDSVIEFKNGFCEKYNVKIGDKITFSRNIKLKKAGLKEN